MFTYQTPTRHALLAHEKRHLYGALAWYTVLTCCMSKEMGATTSEYATWRTWKKSEKFMQIQSVKCIQTRDNQKYFLEYTDPS